MIPLTKYFWKKGYTSRIGRITTTETVILMEVGVCIVASEEVLITVPFLIMAARELAGCAFFTCA